MIGLTLMSNILAEQIKSSQKSKSICWRQEKEKLLQTFKKQANSQQRSRTSERHSKIRNLVDSLYRQPTPERPVASSKLMKQAHQLENEMTLSSILQHYQKSRQNQQTQQLQQSQVINNPIAEQIIEAFQQLRKNSAQKQQLQYCYSESHLSDNNSVHKHNILSRINQIKEFLDSKLTDNQEEKTKITPLNIESMFQSEGSCSAERSSSNLLQRIAKLRQAKSQATLDIGIQVDINESFPKENHFDVSSVRHSNFKDTKPDREDSIQSYFYQLDQNLPRGSVRKSFRLDQRSSKRPSKENSPKYTATKENSPKHIPNKENSPKVLTTKENSPKANCSRVNSLKLIAPKENSPKELRKRENSPKESSARLDSQQALDTKQSPMRKLSCASIESKGEQGQVNESQFEQYYKQQLKRLETPLEAKYDHLAKCENSQGLEPFQSVKKSAQKETQRTPNVQLSTSTQFQIQISPSKVFRPVEIKTDQFQFQNLGELQHQPINLQNLTCYFNERPKIRVEDQEAHHSDRYFQFKEQTHQFPPLGQQLAKAQNKMFTFEDRLPTLDLNPLTLNPSMAASDQQMLHQEFMLTTERQELYTQVPLQNIITEKSMQENTVVDNQDNLQYSEDTAIQRVQTQVSQNPVRPQPYEGMTQSSFEQWLQQVDAKKIINFNCQSQYFSNKEKVDHSTQINKQDLSDSESDEEIVYIKKKQKETQVNIGISNLVRKLASTLKLNMMKSFYQIAQHRKKGEPKTESKGEPPKPIERIRQASYYQKLKKSESLACVPNTKEMLQQITTPGAQFGNPNPVNPVQEINERIKVNFIQEMGLESPAQKNTEHAELIDYSPIAEPMEFQDISANRELKSRPKNASCQKEPYLIEYESRESSKHIQILTNHIAIQKARIGKKFQQITYKKRGSRKENCQ